MQKILELTMKEFDCVYPIFYQVFSYSPILVIYITRIDNLSDSQNRAPKYYADVKSYSTNRRTYLQNTLIYKIHNRNLYIL